jgi:transposase-like protein
VKVASRWHYVYRAIDQFGQVIDVFVSARRNMSAARRFFERAIGTTNVTPIEVVTDRTSTSPAVLEELLPAAWHRTDRYANSHVEADHARLKPRLQPMRGLKQDRSATVVLAGHAFVQNLRRDTTSLRSRSQQAFELPSRLTSWPRRSDSLAGYGFGMPPVDQMQQSRPGSPAARSGTRCATPGS